MMTEDRTAASRLPDHMARRADYLGALNRIGSGGASPEDYATADIEPGHSDDPAEVASDAIFDLALAVDTFRTVKVTLSTGGPADGLTFHINSDGEAYDVRYWFADWFDYAEREVPEGSPLLDYAADIAEMVHQTEDR